MLSPHGTVRLLSDTVLRVTGSATATFTASAPDASTTMVERIGTAWSLHRRCERGSGGGELATGGLDVAAAGQPHRRGEASPVEAVLERRDRLTRRALVEPGRVVRDQVDLERLRIEESRERSRLLDSVV